MKITVGGTALTVTAVGRWCISGNHLSHDIGIYEDSVPNFPLMTGSLATINMTGKPAGQFSYVSLSSTVVLWPGTTYYIMSSEANGGDQWYDSATTATTTAVAALIDAAVSVSPAVYITSIGAGAGHTLGPVDFKYNLGTPGVSVVKGSPYPAGNRDTTLLPIGSGGGSTFPIMTGTVALSATDVHGGGISGNFTYQWLFNGVAVSPVLTGSDATLPWSCNTLTAIGGGPIPDGTYIIYPQILDLNTTSIFNIASEGLSVIVKNTAFNNGAQTVPVSANSSNRTVSPLPDFVAYDPSNPYPARTAHPISYTFIAGSNSSTLRDSTLWYGEAWMGPRNPEYNCSPQWVTTPSGGIYANWPETDPGLLVDDTLYLIVTYFNNMDGVRMNGTLSPFVNFVEDPAGGGKWWGAEVNGRVFTITPDGTITTIVGRKRDRSQPTYDPSFPGLTEGQVDTKITDVGTFPGGVSNLAGANDLCFDPRDSNILYVAAQVDNWVARVNLTTLVITVYAGSPGAPNGYTGDGGLAISATFAQPTSLIMDASGNLYVCDSFNSAIRKILPGSGTAAGNISTLCGGTVGPSIPIIGDMTGGIAYPVGSGSITWNAGTATGAVLMQNATTIKLGYTLVLSGATTASGSPNQRYRVTAFTNSQQFSVQLNDITQTLPTGVMGGSPVFNTLNADVYSSPTSVSFAAGYLPFPNTLRFASGGDIIVAEGVTDVVRRVNLGSSTLTRIGTFSNYLDQDTGPAWIWLDVDTGPLSSPAGMCGPLDDIFLFKIQDPVSGAHYTWRMSLATDSIGRPTYSAAFIGDGGTRLPQYGPIDWINFVHYPWAISLSRTEGRFIGSGVAETAAVMGRIKQSGDPVVDLSTNYDGATFDRGGQIHIFGSTGGFPPGMRPSFWSLRGTMGDGFILNSAGNNTFEDLNATYATDGALAAYIQAGMGGAVPRPEMVGNDLRDYIYFIRRGTYAGSLPAPVVPGADDANNAPAMILTLSVVRNSAIQITVTWTTDLPTVGIVAVAPPGQRALSVYSIFSTLSAPSGTYATSHSKACQVISGDTPVHYTVVVQTQHGIFTHAADQTVT
jgi:hypothetical protein